MARHAVIDHKTNKVLNVVELEHPAFKGLVVEDPEHLVIPASQFVHVGYTYDPNTNSFPEAAQDEQAHQERLEREAREAREREEAEQQQTQQPLALESPVIEGEFHEVAGPELQIEAPAAPVTEEVAPVNEEAETPPPAKPAKASKTKQQ